MSLLGTWMLIILKGLTCNYNRAIEGIIYCKKG
jgi:hypothetical protein